MKFISISLLACCLLVVSVHNVLAQGRNVEYVSDQLEITLRKGKTNQHQIIRMLRSGAPVEVLEVDKEAGQARVRTADKAEGWVLTRYLSNEPVARTRMTQMEQQVMSLQNENRQLRTEVGQSTQQRNELGSNHKQLLEENNRLKEELTVIRQTAASAIAIDSENKQVKEKLFALERDAQVHQQENAALKDRNDRDWFLAGAGVIFVGMIIGLIIPKMRWRKRSSWDSL